MDYKSIIVDAAVWVDGHHTAHKNETLCFHDMAHTRQVVEATNAIAGHYGLNEQDYFIVVISAYFHDVGYHTGPAGGHELRSAAIAADFLRGHHVSEEIISAIGQCIMATCIPQTPTNLLEQIVCDADLFHLGSVDFMARNRLMRREARAFMGIPISKEDWCNKTISFMQHHRYHTDYARHKLGEQKHRNLESLRAGQKPGDEIRKKGASERPDRGIETMFRVTATNNQRLSDMADNKANILITVNSIILSVVIALLLRKLDDYAQLTIPTFVLLAVSLSTMVCAILATRPSIPKGTYALGDVQAGKVNLLFFGNFHRMSLGDYNEGMKSIMEDRDLLYTTLIQDIYSQGVVLGRKYRLLRLAYNIFMHGLIVSVLAFIAIIIIFNP